LNPILSAGGSGAAMAAPSAPQVQPVDAMSKAIHSGVSSSMDAMRLKKELEAKTADIDLANAQTSLNKKNREILDTSAVKVAHETRRAEAEADAAEVETDVAKALKPARITNADTENTNAKIDKSMAIPDALGRRLLKLIEGSSSAYGTFRGMRTPRDKGTTEVYTNTEGKTSYKTRTPIP